MSRRPLRPSVLLAAALSALGACGGDPFSVDDTGSSELDGSADASEGADARSDRSIARDRDAERGEDDGGEADRVGDVRADRREVGKANDADSETKDARADASEAGRDAAPDQRAEAGARDGARDAPAANDVSIDATADVSDSAETGADSPASEGGADADDTLEGGTCDVRTTYYRDKDGDGVGATDQHVRACAAPGPEWVVDPGDCRDDLSDVKPNVAGVPNPPQPSGMGYPDPTVHQSERREGHRKSTKTGITRRFTIEPALMPLLRAMHQESGGKGRVIDIPDDRQLGRELRRYLNEASVKRADLHANDLTRKPMTRHDLRATGPLGWPSVVTSHSKSCRGRGTRTSKRRSFTSAKPRPFERALGRSSRRAFLVPPFPRRSEREARVVYG